MARSLDRLKESPSQTAGPYVHIGTTPNAIGMGGVYPIDLGSAPLPPGVEGMPVRITGRIFDGAGAVVRDALVEIWHADANGLHPGRGETRGRADPHFPGWFRQAVDGESGRFTLETIKPGSVPYIDGRPMAPHVTFWIVARGINLGLHTRLYFGDEADANAADPVLARIEDKARAATLVAALTETGGMPTYSFDIHLQGDGETVFFDI